jgi:hypothetical protein
MRTEVPLRAHRIVFRGVEREVLTHRNPPRHVFLAEVESAYWYLYADAGGFMRLAELAAAMAASRDRIAFFRHAATRPEGEWADGWEPMDLLLVPRTLQFPASAWKALRSRLGAGTPVTRRGAIPADPDPHVGYRTHGDDPEILDLRSHARTLVVSGSQANFASMAEYFVRMSQSGRDDHAHFQDGFHLRGYPFRLYHQSPHPDLIYMPCTRWLDGEMGVREETRWIWPGTEGYSPADPEPTLRRFEAEGWQVVGQDGPAIELVRRG